MRHRPHSRGAPGPDGSVDSGGNHSGNPFLGGWPVTAEWPVLPVIDSRTGHSMRLAERFSGFRLGLVGLVRLLSVVRRGGLSLTIGFSGHLGLVGLGRLAFVGLVGLVGLILVSL